MTTEQALGKQIIGSLGQKLEGNTAQAEIAIQIGEHLLNDPDITGAVATVVRIGNDIYPGAIYKSERWGRRIYVAGSLPRSYVRYKNVAYKVGIGTADLKWFVAGYNNSKKRPAEAAPFGDYFVLAIHEPLMNDDHPKIMAMSLDAV